MLGIIVLFLKEKNQKNFLWVLVKGLYVICTDIPYDSLGYCKTKRHPRSVIKHKCEVQTRGRQASACFFFYCEEQHRILCLVCSRNNDLYLVCRDRRPRLSNVVTVTAALPSVILPDCRDRRPRRSKLVLITKCTFVRCRNARLTKAFPSGEGGPLAVDEVFIT